MWKARATVVPETAALFIDDKIGGKDRFLTLATTPQSTTQESLYIVIQQQAERIAGAFRLKQDLPFSLDRRMLFSIGGALCSLLLLLYVERLQPSFFTPSQDEFARSQTEIPYETIKALETVAHRLMQKTSTPQEQMTGAQLSALAQQLKDPSLSLQEKQQLVQETQKRLPLDLPFPQLLPFDLQLFASKNQEGDGSEKQDSQAGNAPSANSDPQNGQSQKSTSTSTTGNELQQNVEQNGEQSDQSQPPQPRQEGGGITFNFPQDQQKGQGQAPHDDTFGVGPQSAQEQAKNNLAPGTDPTQPGRDQNDRAQNQNDDKGNTTGEEHNQQSKGEGTVGQGKGERLLQPDAQPGSGFLTEDAQFVKVRVPMGQKAQAADEEGRTSKNGRTTPKTAYSNAPLKESAPEEAQIRQPIPLEYRSILKD